MQPQPSRLTTEILRRAAGGEVVAHPDLEENFWYAYEDGTPLLDRYGRMLSTRAFCRFLRHGWLLPVEVGRWRARSVADGAPPAPEAPKEEEMPEQRPTPQQVAILRRISTHKLVVGFTDGRKGYSYGDGVPISRADAERLIARRWVIPESPGLFHGEEPQTYVARSL